MSVRAIIWMSYFDRWRENHVELLRNIECSIRTKGILLIALHHNYFRKPVQFPAEHSEIVFIFALNTTDQIQHSFERCSCTRTICTLYSIARAYLRKISWITLISLSATNSFHFGIVFNLNLAALIFHTDIVIGRRCLPVTNNTPEAHLIHFN